MSNFTIKEKDKIEKEIKKIPISKNPTLAQKEKSKKNKLIKIKSYNINRRTLFINKNRLIEDNEVNNDKDNEPLIKSNNFIARKREYIIHSAKKLRNNLERKINNSKNNNELLNNNILYFRPETERNSRMDKLIKGFMSKKDYDLNNLIIKKNKKGRAKTARINNRRVDKSINVIENNINEFIKAPNSFEDNKINVNNYYDYNYNLNINSNINKYKTLSNGISNINEDEIIKKKGNNNIYNIFTDIEHKVLFIDNKNNVISKNNILNLLTEEQYLIIKKLKKDYKIKNFSKYIKNTEGKKVILPILFKNILNRNNNNDLYNIETNNNISFKLEKEKNNNLNKTYFTLDLKPKSSKPGSMNINDFIDGFSNSNKKWTDIFIPEDSKRQLNVLFNKEDSNKIENDIFIPEDSNKIENDIFISKYLNKKRDDIFITNNTNKKKLNLNHENFNNIILINKKKIKNNYDKLQKRNNSTTYKNIYFNFDSKYPYTDTNGFDIKDNIENNNKPITDRKKYNYKNIFKKKLRKFIKRNTGVTNDINKIKKYKVSKAKKNIKESEKMDSLDNNLNDKNKNKNKKINEEEKDKKEEKLKTEKNNKVIKSKENKKIKNVRKISIKTYKNNSNKIKNSDLLKIKKEYKESYERNKNNFIEGLITDIQKNNDNNNNNEQKKNLDLNNIYNKYFSNRNKNINILENEQKIDETNNNKEKKNINPKKLNLLINHIKKILNNEKRKEEKKQIEKNEEDLRKSYQLFKEQIEKYDKVKVSKLKRLFSEMHNSNNGEYIPRKSFMHSYTKNYNRYEGSLMKKNNINDIETIKDEENEEEKNKKIIKNEKNKLLIEQMNLINEIKFYMSTMDDPEHQKKFENLIKQIESYKKLDDLEYIRSIKENFGNFKDEIEDIFRTKEIEDRINGFITNLDKEINKVEIKRNFYENLLNVIDHKFKLIFSKPQI